MAGIIPLPHIEPELLYNCLIMGEDKEIPTNEKRPPEVLSREYREAYNKLKSYVDNKDNEIIENYPRLADITYPLGEHLRTVIESKGKQSVENKNNKGISCKGDRNWINPRWAVPEYKKVDVSAVHIPENNCIHISGSTQEHGYQIYIPVDTSMLGLFVQRKLPTITLWVGHEDTLIYNPASDKHKKSPENLAMYSGCLYESVSAIFKALPKPVAD